MLVLSFMGCYSLTLVQAICGMWFMHCISFLKKKKIINSKTHLAQSFGGTGDL